MPRCFRCVPIVVFSASAAVTFRLCCLFDFSTFRVLLYFSMFHGFSTFRVFAVLFDFSRLFDIFGLFAAFRLFAFCCTFCGFSTCRFSRKIFILLPLFDFSLFDFSRSRAHSRSQTQFAACAWLGTTASPQHGGNSDRTDPARPCLWMQCTSWRPAWRTWTAWWRKVVKRER